MTHYTYTEETNNIKSADEPKRGPIGVHVNLDLWKKFRIQAYKEDTTATSLLEKLMQEYIRNKE